MYNPTNSNYLTAAYQTPNRLTAQQMTQPVTQAQPIIQTSSPFLKGRLVSSIEEARAQTIDFDGSVFYFPDLANRKIYTKQINLDGTSTLNMYELKEIPQPVMVTPGQEYVTREEFKQTLEELKSTMAATQVKGTEEPTTPAPTPKPKITYDF